MVAALLDEALPGDVLPLPAVVISSDKLRVRGPFLTFRAPGHAWQYLHCPSGAAHLPFTSEPHKAGLVVEVLAES